MQLAWAKVMDGSLAPVPWEDFDSALVKKRHPQRKGYTLDVFRDRLRPRDVVGTTQKGDEYVVSDVAVANTPCNVPKSDVG